MRLNDRLCSDDHERLHRGLRWGLALSALGWFLLGALGLASVRWLDMVIRWVVAR